MTQDTALKVSLLLKSAAFLEDVEKVASTLHLNEAQKADMVIMAAEAMNTQNIEKQAGPGAAIAEKAPGIVEKILAWLGKNPGKEGLALGGAGGAGLGTLLGRMTASKPVEPNPLGTGLGALVGGGLGAYAGKKLAPDEKEDTVPTILGGALGAGAGGLAGHYLQKSLGNI